MEERKTFAQYATNNNITGSNVLFTNEKPFFISLKQNCQTNQIRLDKKGRKQFEKGDPEILSLLKLPEPNVTKGIMVAGGMCSKGLTDLVFCIGSMDAYSYHLTLDVYKHNLNRLGDELYFQQDYTQPHKAKASLDKVNEVFKNNIINWPRNYSQLNPIEKLWAILKEKVEKKKCKTLCDLKAHVLTLWNSVPVSLCKKLCSDFDSSIESMKKTGKILNQQHYTNIQSSQWIPWNTSSVPEQIVFNKKFLEQHKKNYVNQLSLTLDVLKKIVTQSTISNTTFLKIRKLIGLQEALYYKNKINYNKQTIESIIQELIDKIKKYKAMDIEQYYEDLKNRNKLHRLISLHHKDRTS